MRARRGALTAALALLPGLAAAQARIFAGGEATGTVLGRVCLDEDGDGSCGEGEPGVPGARLLLDGGQVAVADAEGRFHFHSVPARRLDPGRSAYGGHLLALETAPGEIRLRRSFELSPEGAARVDLAVPLRPVKAGPRLLPAGRSGPSGPRREGERLHWTLSGHGPPGSRVAVDGRPAQVEPDGAYFAPVVLAPDENGFGLAVEEGDGRLSLYRQAVYWVGREEGGDLLVPQLPELLATVALPPGGEARGTELWLRGFIAPGARLTIAGAPVKPLASGDFEARVPLPAGQSELHVEAKGALGSASAAPILRLQRHGGAVAALADLELSYGRSKALLTGRGAAAARGVWGEVEGEAGVDLDDRDRSLASLLRPRDVLALERQLDPARSFPTAGDDAAADDPNAARGRLYARLQAPGARLDLGALRPGQTGSELGRYDRALFGGKLAGEGQLGPLRLEASAFGTTARADPGQAGPPRPAHDVLDASGGSLYWLRHGEVVAGSEALRVEWRDPLTGLVEDQRALVRTVDYQIDYPSGRVLLSRPLASVAGRKAAVTGDPLSAARATLLADYSHLAGGVKEDARGARAAIAAGPLSLGVAYDSEDRPGGPYALAAGAVEARLGAPLTVRAEAAQSRGSAFLHSGELGWSRSGDGGLTFAAPQGAATPAGRRFAWHLEARGETAGARYAAWWRDRPLGYSDSSHLETRDALERGASASWSDGPAEVGALWAERRGADPRDASGAAALDARQARARASYSLGEWKLTAEAVEARVEAADGRGSQTSAGLRVDSGVLPWLALDAAWHQSLSRDGSGPAAREATLGSVGAKLSGEPGALSAEVGWGPALGPRLLLGGEARQPDGATYGTFSVDPDGPSLLRESVSAMGVRRAEGSAEVFSEEQFARDPFGLRVSRVSGAALEPLPGLRLSGRAESGSRLRLDGSTVSRWAAGGAASWMARAVRLAGRGEVRSEGDLRQRVLGAAAEWRASARWRLSASGSWSRATGAGKDALSLDAAVGGAYRGDGVLLLAKVGAIAEERPGAARRDAALASVAGTFDLGARLALGLGLAYGANRLAGARQDILAGSARALVRIAGPLDAAAEYARRQALKGSSPESLGAGRVEAGLALGEGRLALGYNLFGFSGIGVDPVGDSDGRVYLRAQLVY